MLAAKTVVVDSVSAEATDRAPVPLVGSDLSFLTFQLGGRCCGLVPSSFVNSLLLEDLISPDCGEILSFNASVGLVREDCTSDLVNGLIRLLLLSSSLILLAFCCCCRRLFELVRKSS